MSEGGAGFGIHPVGTARSTVAGGCELAAVATLAVDVTVLAVVDGIKVELLGASGARGALLVVALAVGVNLLGLKDGPTTPAKVRNS